MNSPEQGPVPAFTVDAGVPTAPIAPIMPNRRLGRGIAGATLAVAAFGIPMSVAMAVGEGSATVAAADPNAENPYAPDSVSVTPDCDALTAKVVAKGSTGSQLDVYMHVYGDGDTAGKDDTQGSKPNGDYKFIVTDEPITSAQTAVTVQILGSAIGTEKYKGTIDIDGGSCDSQQPTDTPTTPTPTPTVTKTTGRPSSSETPTSNPTGAITVTAGGNPNTFPTQSNSEVAQGGNDSDNDDSDKTPVDKPTIYGAPQTGPNEMMSEAAPVAGVAGGLVALGGVAMFTTATGKRVRTTLSGPFKSGTHA